MEQTTHFYPRTAKDGLATRITSPENNTTVPLQRDGPFRRTGAIVAYDINLVGNMCGAGGNTLRPEYGKTGILYRFNLGMAYDVNLIGNTKISSSSLRQYVL